MEKKSRSVQVEYFIDGDFSTPLNEFYSLLEALAETDGFFNFIAINDMATEKYLIAKDVVKKSARGSCYRTVIGNKFNEFFKEVETLIFNN